MKKEKEERVPLMENAADSFMAIFGFYRYETPKEFAASLKQVTPNEDEIKAMNNYKLEQVKKQH